MSKPNKTITISFSLLKSTLFNKLQKLGFSDNDAEICATVFSENTLDGVYSHGINRFQLFTELVKKEYVAIDGKPTLINAVGALEQWDGNRGAGILNGLIATERSMELASTHGMGCVALSNTNHWMRAGNYGWKAAKKGFIFMGWTNTIPNMPAWGAKDLKLGNNPFVVAVPYENEAIVIDMAMSQYSYGKMEDYASKGFSLEVPGGYNLNDELSDKPSEILESKRPLPIGYWKGAGLSLLLDLLATLLSGGSSTHQLGKQNAEYGVSQIFIAFNMKKLSHFGQIAEMTANIINDFKKSQTTSDFNEVYYPGEKSLHTRKVNLEKGIPVDKSLWDIITKL